MVESTASGKAKVTRNRKPSLFAPAHRVTLAYHADVAPKTLTELTEEFEVAYAPLAVRVVSHTRARKAGSKAAAGPTAVMVYVAPEGYKFAATGERGVRLDSETANLLRAVAQSMGLDPNDSASIVAVAKALATKAQAATN